MALYAKIDLNLPKDKRIRRAGAMAELLYIRCILLAKELLSDGEIDDSQIDLAAVGIPGKPRDHAAKLVTVGLWEVTDTGWRIPLEKWAKYQTTAKEIANLQESRSKAGSKGAAKRWQKDDNEMASCHQPEWQEPSGENSQSQSQTSESKPESKKVGSGRFQKPTTDEVRAYGAEISSIVDPQEFVDFYESKGWKIGKSPMADWKSCFRRWGRNQNGRDQQKPKPDRVYNPKTDGPYDPYAQD